MSIENLDLLSDEDLWEKMKRMKDWKDYNDECDTCGKPKILHVGVCIRSEKVIGKELEEIQCKEINEIWRMFRK